MTASISCPGSSNERPRELRRRSRARRIQYMITDSIAGLSRALAEKRLSSLELTDGLLARIAQHNPALNAFVTIDAERARASAKAADQARAAGNAGPLTGIPIAHKDVLMTAGLRTTCGSRMLDNFVAPYDARVVSGLKRAGTV